MKKNSSTFGPGTILILVFSFAFFCLSSCEDDVKKEETKSLTGFYPELGGEGDLITITGSKFADFSKLEVRIGEYFAQIESATTNEILVRLPQYIQKCGEVPITVVSDTITLVSKTKFMLACPEIESVSPNRGNFGDIITIKGSYFTSDPSRIHVTIGNGFAEVIAATNTIINARLINGNSGNFPVKIQIQEKVAVSTDSFRINGPMITRFFPSTITGCDQITITGSDFSPIATENHVLFGYLKGTVEHATSTQLIVTPPAGLKEINGNSYKLFVSVNEVAAVSQDSITISESAWQKVASLGNGGRWRGVGFSINDKGYVGIGIGPLADLTRDFWQYDQTLDIWNQKADFPGVARMDAIGFSLEGKGYVGLGRDHSNNYFIDFWEYNPLTETWLQMPDFPGAGRAGAISFSIAGHGYVGVGDGVGDCSDVWKFNPADKTWAKVTHYPGVGTNGMVCFAISDKAYMGTGAATNDFWEYTPFTNQWRQLKDVPERFIHHGVSFAFQGFGIAGTGGTENGERMDDVWKYDPVNDRWSRLADLKGNVRNFAVGFPFDNTFVIGSGSTTYNIDAVNDFYKYVCP